MDAQLQQKLKEVKAKIKTNSKDAHFAEALIDELVGLQKQADIEPVELIVPSAEVEHTYQIDDVTTLIKTAKGYLYKHGKLSYIWVPFGLNTLWKTLNELDEISPIPSIPKARENQSSAIWRERDMIIRTWSLRSADVAHARNAPTHLKISLRIYSMASTPRN